MLGTIKFIGELFKIGLITEMIIFECITCLLGDVKNPVPEDIDALLLLLTTTGAYIDHPGAAKYMDTYFAYLVFLSQNMTLPPRLCFALKDLIELRAHKWVAGRTVIRTTHHHRHES